MFCCHARVAAPKLGPLATMSTHLSGQPLQQHVVFSSVASLIGAQGQANYVAANGGLDNYAARRLTSGEACCARLRICVIEMHLSCYLRMLNVVFCLTPCAQLRLFL